MSSGNPGDGLNDRPKMAEALASLKEGLGDKDDPFYDGWKLRKGAGDAADNLAAAGEATQSEGDGTDTVPVRVVRYLVFPKWAIMLAAALVAFAVMVTVVRLGFRTNAVPSAPATPVLNGGDESHNAASDAPRPAPSGTAAGVTPTGTAAAHKAKGKKSKTPDPGFFHDPGF